MADSLVSDLIRHTGLPENGVRKELERLLEKAGHDESTVTIDEIRDLVSDYLQDVFNENLDSAS